MRKLLVLAASFALALGAAACGDDDSGNGGGSAGADGGSLSGTIAGAGASSQAAAMEAWIAGFQESNPDATVSYDPIGSGGGREQFLAGGSLFGGTDAALDDEELRTAEKRCGQVIEAPVYISPIAIAYNLDGVDELRLSADTLAKIFNQEIANWNDPAIAKDNPDAELPDQRITVVHRSDESGTTENLAEYLAAAAPAAWPHEVSGDWPVKGGEAAQGTSGVVDAIGAGQGTIGYADASQAGGLSIAEIKVGDDYVGPSPEAAAAIVDNSPQVEGQDEYVFVYELERDTTAAGTYPIVLVSYMMACSEYDSADDAALVQGFLDYIVSPEGQDAAASAAGSAPISDRLRNQVEPAIDAISGGGSGS